MQESWTHETAHDISAGGLCFLTEEPVGEGETLDVQFHLPDQHAPHSFKAKVIWDRRPEGHSRWMKVCGIAFDGVTATEKMQLDSAINFLIKADRQPHMACAH
jgi:hypothetical protein